MQDTEKYLANELSMRQKIKGLWSKQKLAIDHNVKLQETKKAQTWS